MGLGRVPLRELTFWWGHWVAKGTVTNLVWFIRKGVTEENMKWGEVWKADGKRSRGGRGEVHPRDDPVCPSGSSEGGRGL